MDCYNKSFAVLMFCAEILRITVFLCKEAKGRSKCATTSQRSSIAFFAGSVNDAGQVLTTPTAG